MRRYKLTSPKFTGAVEAIYDMNEKLCRIEFTTANLQPEQIDWFKKRIPVLLENVEKAFEETGIQYTEAEFEVSFADFRREYPRKRNTHLAEKYWPRLTSAKQYLAYVAAIEYAKYCNRKSFAQEFIMLPEKFLKDEHWKNDWKNQ